MRSTVATAIVGMLIALATPALAGAHPRTLPPGNSGADQYIEIVPTATGGRPSSNVQPGSKTTGHNDGSGAIAPSTQQALSASGRDGSEAAALASATAPVTVHGVPADRHGKHGTRPTTQQSPQPPTATIPSAGKTTLVSQILKAVSGSSHGTGLGLILPLLLVLTPLAAAILTIAGRRRRAT